jgi:hypothetical protein
LNIVVKPLTQAKASGTALETDSIDYNGATTRTCIVEFYAQSVKFSIFKEFHVTFEGITLRPHPEFFLPGCDYSTAKEWCRHCHSESLVQMGTQKTCGKTDPPDCTTAAGNAITLANSQKDNFHSILKLGGSMCDDSSMKSEAQEYNSHYIFMVKAESSTGLAVTTGTHDAGFAFRNCKITGFRMRYDSFIHMYNGQLVLDSVEFSYMEPGKYSMPTATSEVSLHGIITTGEPRTGTDARYLCTFTDNNDTTNQKASRPCVEITWTGGKVEYLNHDLNIGKQTATNLASTWYGFIHASYVGKLAVSGVTF